VKLLRTLPLDSAVHVDSWPDSAVLPLMPLFVSLYWAVAMHGSNSVASLVLPLSLHDLAPCRRVLFLCLCFAVRVLLHPTWICYGSFPRSARRDSCCLLFYFYFIFLSLSLSASLTLV
jgi:hypothetical protein